MTNQNANINDFHYGVYLFSSSFSTVSGNNITNNDCYGVFLNWESDNNTISGNNIANNECGVYLSACKGRECSDNKFYHNNFIGNARQVYIVLCGPLTRSMNFWNDGVEGNYWSNYAEVDSNHNGVGDSPYVLNAENHDNGPLMGMFHSFNTSSGYSVNVISNSTIEDFQYFESNSTIKMHVSNMNPSQTFGFCRIRIPYALMNGTYHVIVDGAEPYYVNYTLYDDGDNRWIYFACEHSIHEIIIVLEFPPFLIPPLFMIATLLTVIAYRRKHETEKTDNHVVGSLSSLKTAAAQNE